MKGCRGPWNVLFDESRQRAPSDGDKEGSHALDRAPPEGMWVLGSGGLPSLGHFSPSGSGQEKLEDVAGRDAGRNVSK